MALDINSIIQAAKEKVAATSATSAVASGTPSAPRPTIDVRTVDAESLKTKASSGAK